MRIDLTLKNYRGFPDSRPARLAIRKGMTAFVGPNNSGKSALLRFFYEFRDLVLRISEPSDPLLDALRGNRTGFNLQGIADTGEVFSNETPRDLRLEIDASPEDKIVALPLWQQERPVNASESWSVGEAYASEAACRERQSAYPKPKDDGAYLEITRDGTKLKIRWVCLPDTVDPRSKAAR